MGRQTGLVLLGLPRHIYLNLIGYEDRGNGDEPGRRYFVKGVEEKRTHHLKFCELNGVFWTRHVGPPKEPDSSLPQRVRRRL